MQTRFFEQLTIRKHPRHPLDSDDDAAMDRSVGATSYLRTVSESLFLRAFHVGHKPLSPLLLSTFFESPSRPVFSGCCGHAGTSRAPKTMSAVVATPEKQHQSEKFQGIDRNV
jgi:hypothetical protein